MDRRLFLVPAVVFALGAALLYAVFGPPHTLPFLALTGSLVLSALCFAVAGLRPSVSVADREVPWYVFVGAGDVVLGVGVVLNAAGTLDGGARDLFPAAITAASGLFLAFVGVDYLRGGRYLDVSAFE